MVSDVGGQALDLARSQAVTEASGGLVRQARQGALRCRSNHCTETRVAARGNRQLFTDLKMPNFGDDALVYRGVAKASPLLGQLSEQDLQSLLSCSTLVTLAAGEPLVRQGAPSDSAYLLVEGEVDVLVETAYGSVHLAKVPSGAIVGEIGVFTDVSRTATVVASGPVRAVKLERGDLLRAGAHSPAFLRSIMVKLGQYIMTFNNAIGFYTHALNAIEQETFDLRLLDDLMQPVPELVNFAETFRRMARQVVLRQEHRKEMANAAAIQRAFLPELPLLADSAGSVDLHAEMVSAKEVGGDLYDFLLLDEQSLAITIGDVSGKGIPAALFMAVVQSVLRLVLRQGGELADRVRAANDLLISFNKESLFATLFCGLLDIPTGTLIYCNCGHNAPLISRNGDGSLEKLGRTGPPLGLLAGSEYSTQRVQLMQGDTVILFTDGITEALNEANELYGDGRLENTIKDRLDKSARDLIARIFDSVRRFTGNAPQSDDMTCLTLRCGGPIIPPS
jgi:phosphoserine phosphatase RsbU/P